MADIQRLNELHAATTQGPWKSCQAIKATCPCGNVWADDTDAMVATAAGDDSETQLPDEQKRANGDFIAESHNSWPAVAARLAVLEEFALRVRDAVAHPTQGEVCVYASAAVSYLGVETKKAGQ